MPKLIKRETDFAIKWLQADQVWYVDISAIGGRRLKSKEKDELKTKRREAWLRWCGQDVEDAVPERPWTLDEVLADYTELFNDRVANDDDQCGGIHKDSILANLTHICIGKWLPSL